MSLFALRLNLRARGYLPVPVIGKAPPLEGWSQIEATEEQIKEWEQTYPYAQSTGILTKLAPAFDIDIQNPEAAEAVEELVRERFIEGGLILVRIGQAPKRAILFRCDQPFPKITVSFESEEKLEFLADGQ